MGQEVAAFSHLDTLQVHFVHPTSSKGLESSHSVAVNSFQDDDVAVTNTGGPGQFSVMIRSRGSSSLRDLQPSVPCRCAKYRVRMEIDYDTA